ncbi:MAG: hypothetical protein QM523_09950 [Candidatus Pacebacteria bacterium]|nr:hypothetical protein [Candidatus Paceibacterota bacterium]
MKSKLINTITLLSLLAVGIGGCVSILSPIQSYDKQANCRRQMIAATPESYLSGFTFVTRRNLERTDVYVTAKARPSYFSRSRGLDYYHCVYTAGFASSADRQQVPVEPSTPATTPPKP